MTSASPAAAIEARLRANWTATPIVVENPSSSRYPTDPDNGSALPFVALEFPGGAAQQLSIGDPGNNAWAEDGAFMLHVLVPTGTETTQLRTYADQLAAIFRGQQFDFVTCYAPNPPIPGGQPLNGLYYSMSVSVPYRYQYLG